jgi:hypothetical protein
MRERRGTMPGLNLISEDNLYLAFVSTTDFDPWLYDLIDGNGKLAANRRGDYVQNRRADLRDNSHLKGQT